MGLGRPGLLLVEGLGGRPSCTGVRGGWLSGAGMRDTPAVVGCWGCCGRGGLLVVGAPACVGVACCRGSGAVRPGCLTCLGLLVCWGLWVGVGGLVVNCIVDASILL